jgi:hypothetical protein
MFKLISAFFFVIILCSNYFAQPKPFGYRIFGNGEIISSDFHIEDGFVLDSVTSYGITYRFEYDSNKKLSRDINLTTYQLRELVNGQYKYRVLPGFRDYFYNEDGNVDSILVRYWHDSLNVWMENISYSINYFYNENGSLQSKMYSNSTNIDEYNYDSTGKLIAINTISGSDTLSIVREYDMQNRLILSKRLINGIATGDQYIYQYDSTGNVNLLYRTVNNDKINNKFNYYFQFDESGRVTYEIASSSFLPDSTWKDNHEISFNYDEYGRILEMGPYSWFHYNSDGNLDSMVITHIIPSGFLANKGTLVDSYGNKITLPNYTTIHQFYYSKLITGIKRDETVNKTFILFKLSESI